MYSHVLDAHQVLPSGDLGGQLEAELVFVPAEPAFVGTVPRHGGAELEDFEPVTGAIVVPDVAWSLGHVHLDVLARASDVVPTEAFHLPLGAQGAGYEPGHSSGTRRCPFLR
jgi:hypothetical protein